MPSFLVWLWWLHRSIGPLSELVIPVDKKTKSQKGVAIVTFMMPEHAVTAFNALEGAHFEVGLAVCSLSLNVPCLHLESSKKRHHLFLHDCWYPSLEELSFDCVSQKNFA